MKKISLLLSIIIALFIFSSAVFAYQVTATLTWDPNTESDMAGYRIFQRFESDSYDYSNPAADISCTVSDGQCTPCEATIFFEVGDGESKTVYCVARAYDTDENESEDSDEVSEIIDRTTLPIPTDITGAWNDAEQTIDITWKQTDVDRVVKWVVMYGDVSGGEYSDSYEVENIGQTSYAASVPISISDSAPVTKYFVVKGVAKYSVESELSLEVAVVVDQAPGKMIELRFKIIE